MKIEYKQIGRNLVLNIEGKKITFTAPTEELKPIKEMVIQYNELPNHKTAKAKAFLSKIEKIVTPVTVAKKEEVEKEKIEKKVIKNKIKEVSKSTTKENLSTLDKIKKLMNKSGLSEIYSLIKKGKSEDKPVPKQAPRRRGEY